VNNTKIAAQTCLAIIIIIIDFSGKHRNSNKPHKTEQKQNVCRIVTSKNKKQAAWAAYL